MKKLSTMATEGQSRSASWELGVELVEEIKKKNNPDLLDFSSGVVKSLVLDYITLQGPCCVPRVSSSSVISV